MERIWFHHFNNCCMPITACINIAMLTLNLPDQVIVKVLYAEGCISFGLMESVIVGGGISSQFHSKWLLFSSFHRVESISPVYHVILGDL